MTEKMYLTSKYIENNPTWHVEDSIWKVNHILDIIERNKLQPGSICEVGCGAGEILNQMYKKMPENISFVGYEISPQAFELCQKKKEDRLQFNLKNFLMENKVFFDVLLAIDVIEHIEDYFGFIRKIREKGQYKIFHIPLEISAQSVLRVSPLLNSRKSVGHIHYFSKETALATLTDCGYEIIDYFYTAGAIDLPSKSLKSLLAKLPRKFLYKYNKDIAVRVLGGYSLMALTK